MKALYSTPIANSQLFALNLTVRPIPTLVPASVLVQVHAAGINPSDSANAFKNRFNSTKPIIPGRDFAGVVHKTNSPTFLPGTSVYGTSGSALSFTQDGTSAEFVLVSEEAVALKPANLSFAQAGCVGTPYTTALGALEAARTRKGQDSILVLGATGAVGSAAAKIGRAWGCRVVTASRRDVTDVNIVTNPDLTRTQELLEGRGPDVVIDAVGSSVLMGAAMNILAPKGRYAFVSAGKGGPATYTVDTFKLYKQDQTICGVNSITQTPQEVGDMMRRLTALFDWGGLEGPEEEYLVKVPIEKGIEAYEETAKMGAKKFVIVFE